ncbi:MAG: hypothetical protein R2795_25040 [Saprospiraceae bacterium]
MDDTQEQGGYRLLIERTFKPLIPKQGKEFQGVLAVVYDKNEMEASGYAESMADVMQEPVYIAPFMKTRQTPVVKFEEGIMFIKDHSGEWLPVRAAFRYVTQRPWNRIPLLTKTKVFNPVLACLAGGRNKMVAAKAYDIFNAEIEEYGLKINTPETIWDVSKSEVPSMGKENGWASRCKSSLQ